MDIKSERRLIWLLAAVDSFVRAVKSHGRKTGRRHEIISNQSLTTSCRKFDQFGDWHFVRIFANPLRVRKAIDGKDKEYLDKNWYEVRR